MVIIFVRVLGIDPIRVTFKVDSEGNHLVGLSTFSYEQVEIQTYIWKYYEKYGKILNAKYKTNIWKKSDIKLGSLGMDINVADLKKKFVY